MPNHPAKLRRRADGRACRTAEGRAARSHNLSGVRCGCCACGVNVAAVLDGVVADEDSSLYTSYVDGEIADGRAVMERVIVPESPCKWQLVVPNYGAAKVVAYEEYEPENPAYRCSRLLEMVLVKVPEFGPDKYQLAIHMGQDNGFVDRPSIFFAEFDWTTKPQTIANQAPGGSGTITLSCTTDPVFMPGGTANDACVQDAYRYKYCVRAVSALAYCNLTPEGRRFSHVLYATGHSSGYGSTEFYGATPEEAETKARNAYGGYSLNAGWIPTTPLEDEAYPRVFNCVVGGPANEDGSGSICDAIPLIEYTRGPPPISWRWFDGPDADVMIAQFPPGVAKHVSEWPGLELFGTVPMDACGEYTGGSGSSSSDPGSSSESSSSAPSSSESSSESSSGSSSESSSSTASSSSGSSGSGSDPGGSSSSGSTGGSTSSSSSGAGGSSSLSSTSSSDPSSSSDPGGSSDDWTPEPPVIPDPQPCTNVTLCGGRNYADPLEVYVDVQFGPTFDGMMPNRAYLRNAYMNLGSRGAVIDHGYRHENVYGTGSLRVTKHCRMPSKWLIEWSIDGYSGLVEIDEFPGQFKTVRLPVTVGSVEGEIAVTLSLLAPCGWDCSFLTNMTLGHSRITDDCKIRLCFGVTIGGTEGEFTHDGKCYQFTLYSEGGVGPSVDNPCSLYLIEVIPC